MIDDKILIELYKKILYVRMVEEKIVELYPKMEMRMPIHLSLGQESVAAGVSQNLNNKDLVLTGHRSHSHYLAKNASLKAFFAELYSKKTGCCKSIGGSMHLRDTSAGFIASTPIVAGSIPLAVGVAFALKYKNKKNIVVCYIGDASTEEGVFWESISLAKVKSLPILFVCENNLYSVQTHINIRQPNRKISDSVASFNIPSTQIDGNNAIEVYQTAKEMIDFIKNGGGPCFLEALTYRTKQHVGPYEDNDREEIQAWKDRCPLKFVENKIKNILSHKQMKNIEDKFKKEIEAAVAFAKASK